MASPLRFRVSHETWHRERFENEVVNPLDNKFGVEVTETSEPEEFEAYRLRMGNGDTALFAWNGTGYWVGNTETPKALWQTEKQSFEEVDDGLGEWAQREFYRVLKDEAPWLTEYTRLAWFFLPVFMSKNGSEATREFFQRGAGFPDASAEEAMEFYETVLESGVFEESRYEMASKLGTGENVDEVRMAAAMGEFNAAGVLDDAGYRLEPEPAVSNGHKLDYEAFGEGAEDGVYVEVTRPVPPEDRAADSPLRAVRETASRKSEGQLKEDDGLLMVDCTSFGEEDWRTLAENRPSVGHTPSLFYRTTPDGESEAFLEGVTGLRLSGGVNWV